MPNRTLDLDDLIASHRLGHAMPRGFYTSQDIYDYDIAQVWNRNWLWVGHESQIPNPGDYFLFDYGPESIIVVRDLDGEIRAHQNVCRHRGSRVCTKAEGRARVFVCPYHAWTFELSGKLRAGQNMGADFDPSKYGLFPVQISVFQGLIFACADAATPALDTVLAQLAPLTAPYGLNDLKIAHTASFPVPANWKLAVENYLECYHCGPAHKEYSRSHSLKSPQEMKGLVGPLRERAKDAGLSADELELIGAAATTPFTSAYYRRYPLYEGYKTGSKTGEALAPLLGSLMSFDGGATDLGIGPLNWFLIYSDHMVGYRFIPRKLQETDIQVVWFVRSDAEDGADYDKDVLAWLWHVTSLDDERIIRHNQSGVNSHHFQPGPLGEMETSLQAFYDFYFAMIGSEQEQRIAIHG
ncbi:aromatic ring-hydroxylating dioxygenase subunit alpha [uncultured Ruegeria sp.]|uniref:aromatic ring-hydroxylating oxygenase subunit alpha n=1 Tax=uncultured Ruegeria sp. TaxID=259304 RepID=UPI00262A25EC|nr:aromatic ring-hydroxylating dioxygenase subunit alpha [uncultured Ruegeria sp.]